MIDRPQPEEWLDGLILRNIASLGIGRPLRRWKTCAIYERLASEGYVQEVPEPNLFFRRFEITETGRAKALASA